MQIYYVWALASCRLAQPAECVALRSTPLACAAAQERAPCTPWKSRLYPEHTDGRATELSSEKQGRHCNLHTCVIDLKSPAYPNMSLSGTCTTTVKWLSYTAKIRSAVTEECTILCTSASTLVMSMLVSVVVMTPFLLFRSPTTFPCSDWFCQINDPLTGLYVQIIQQECVGAVPGIRTAPRHPQTLLAPG